MSTERCASDCPIEFLAIAASVGGAVSAFVRAANRTVARVVTGIRNRRAAALLAGAETARIVVEADAHDGNSQRGAICGAGKDYGAHIALMTAIEFPDVLSCVVSIAGLTDPREMPASDFANVVLLSEARG